MGTEGHSDELLPQDQPDSSDNQHLTPPPSTPLESVKIPLVIPESQKKDTTPQGPVATTENVADATNETELPQLAASPAELVVAPENSSQEEIPAPLQGVEESESLPESEHPEIAGNPPPVSPSLEDEDVPVSDEPVSEQEQEKIPAAPQPAPSPTRRIEPPQKEQSVEKEKKVDPLTRAENLAPISTTDTASLRGSLEETERLRTDLQPLLFSARYEDPQAVPQIVAALHKLQQRETLLREKVTQGERNRQGQQEPPSPVLPDTVKPAPQPKPSTHIPAESTPWEPRGLLSPPDDEELPREAEGHSETPSQTPELASQQQREVAPQVLETSLQPPPSAEQRERIRSYYQNNDNPVEAARMLLEEPSLLSADQHAALEQLYADIRGGIGGRPMDTAWVNNQGALREQLKEKLANVLQISEAPHRKTGQAASSPEPTESSPAGENPTPQTPGSEVSSEIPPYWGVLEQLAIQPHDVLIPHNLRVIPEGKQPTSRSQLPKLWRIIQFRLKDEQATPGLHPETISTMVKLVDTYFSSRSKIGPDTLSRQFGITTQQAEHILALHQSLVESRYADDAARHVLLATVFGLPLKGYGDIRFVEDDLQKRKNEAATELAQEKRADFDRQEQQQGQSGTARDWSTFSQQWDKAMDELIAELLKQMFGFGTRQRPDFEQEMRAREEQLRRTYSQANSARQAGTGAGTSQQPSDAQASTASQTSPQAHASFQTPPQPEPPFPTPPFTPTTPPPFEPPSAAQSQPLGTPPTGKVHISHRPEPPLEPPVEPPNTPAGPTFDGKLPFLTAVPQELGVLATSLNFSILAVWILFMRQLLSNAVAP